MTDGAVPDTREQPEQNVITARLPTSGEQALIEYRKQIILKSHEYAVEFHKTMIGVSATLGTTITTLVPILIWGDKDIKIPALVSWPLIFPPILMVISTVLFALGYYPHREDMKINDIDSVRAARDNLMKYRRNLAIFGLLAFNSSLILMVLLVLYFKY